MASSSSPPAILPPGFRFHPTDEELVSFYLLRKLSGHKIDFEVIAEIDLYKHEPWELPALSCLQTKDPEWYFFNPPDKKYPRGSRTNRSTKGGYWKATGKDRKVFTSCSSVAGTKKTLVFYKGRAPNGERTDWVMHEYQLMPSLDQNVAGFTDNALVLCRIMKKNGPGPNSRSYFHGLQAVDDADLSLPASDQLCPVRTPTQLTLHWSARQDDIDPTDKLQSGQDQQQLMQCPDSAPAMATKGCMDLEPKEWMIGSSASDDQNEEEEEEEDEHDEHVMQQRMWLTDPKDVKEHENTASAWNSYAAWCPTRQPELGSDSPMEGND